METTLRKQLYAIRQVVVAGGAIQPTSSPRHFRTSEKLAGLQRPLPSGKRPAKERGYRRFPRSVLAII